MPLSLQAKAIQRLIAALCSELRGVAVPLVDAFAIPDHILRAPIGLRWAPWPGLGRAGLPTAVRPLCMEFVSTHPTPAPQTPLHPLTHTPPPPPPAPHACLPACSTTAVDPYNEYLTAIGFNV